MGRPTKLWGGLTGSQLAHILGVPETRINQAAKHALDTAAVIAMKNLPAFLRMISDRLDHHTPGMLDILARRERMLEKLRQKAPATSAA
jgi:hypothetical protein